MLIKKRKTVDICSADMESMEVIRIRGDIVYLSVDCNIRAAKSVKNDAYTLEVSSNEVPAVRSKKSYFESAKSASKINSVIKNKSKRRNSTKKASSPKILAAKVDLSTVIPNTEVAAVRSKGTLEKKQLKFTSKNEGVPTVDMSLAASSQAEADQKSASGYLNPMVCLNVVRQLRTDPALFSSRDFPVQGPEKSFAGVRESDGQTTLNTHGKEARKIFNSSWGSELAGRLVFGKNTQTATTKAAVAVPQYRTTSVFTKRVIFKLGLSKMRARPKMYVTFTLKDVTGNIVQEFEKTVNCTTLLNEYFAPRSPPSLTAEWLDDTRVLINVQRRDFKTTHIAIYARPIDNNRQTQESVWSLVEKKRIGRSPYVCTITLNSKFTQIIRVIGLGRQSVPTCEFATVTLGPRASTLNKVNAGHSSLVQTVDDSVSILQVGDAIRVNVDGIPSSAISVSVLRKNHTLHEQSYTHVPDIPTRALSLGPSAAFTIDDKSTQSGHIYSYRCEYISPYGAKMVSLCEPVTEYLSPALDSESLLIGTISARRINGVYSASFSISEPIQPANTTSVVSDMFAGTVVATTALSTALLEETSEENLYAYMVERINTTTGESESFGIFGKGPFVDDANTRKSAGVSEPNILHGYTYQVSLCKRAPTALIEDARIQDQDKLRGISFSRDYSKVLNPSSMRLGAITPTAGRFSKSVGSLPTEVYDGRTGIKSAVTVAPLQKKSASVINVTVTSRKRYNYITWVWSGNNSQVDHFLIMAQYGGVKAPIASVHSFGDYTHYFKDNQLSARVGKILYSVVPVMIDYSTGNESKSVSVSNRGNA